MSKYHRSDKCPQCDVRCAMCDERGMGGRFQRPRWKRGDIASSFGNEEERKS